MNIARAKVTPIAFRDPPLLNASGIHEPWALRSIVEIETDCGIVGLGESYGDAPVLTRLQAIAPKLKGLDPFDLNRLRILIANQLTAGSDNNPVSVELAPGTHPNKLIASCYAAFEVACLDIQARYLGAPLVDLLGGAVRHAVPFSAYLFFKYAEHIDRPYAPDHWGAAVKPDQIVAQARRMIEAHGFGSIKLKGGTLLGPDLEVDCCLALKQSFPDHPLRIDPNGNWSLETAIRMAARLDGALEYFEDPTPDLESLAELHQRTGLNLATNMVVTDFDEFRRNISIGGIQTVLSDHHYWGGLHDTRLLARMCDIFGLGLSMHSNSHLGISLMAMTHVAASVPNVDFACDTHYPWQEDDEEIIIGGKVKFIDGCIHLSDAHGLGVELDQDQLARLHEQYLSCGIRGRDDVTQMRRYDPHWKALKPRF